MTELRRVIAFPGLAPDFIPYPWVEELRTQLGTGINVQSIWRPNHRNSDPASLISRCDPNTTALVGYSSGTERVVRALEGIAPGLPFQAAALLAPYAPNETRTMRGFDHWLALQEAKLLGYRQEPLAPPQISAGAKRILLLSGKNDSGVRPNFHPDLLCTLQETNQNVYGKELPGGHLAPVSKGAIKTLADFLLRRGSFDM